MRKSLKLQFSADFNGDFSDNISEMGFFSRHNKLVVHVDAKLIFIGLDRILMAKDGKWC